MKRVNHILVAALIPIGETHKLFSHLEGCVSPFLFSEKCLHPQWIAKNVGEMLQFAIISFIAWDMSKRVHGIAEFRMCLQLIFIWSWIDFCFYFISYKHGGYGLVYFLLCIILIGIKFFKKAK